MSTKTEDTKIDENAASDTIVAHNPSSRTELLSLITTSLVGKNYSELTDFFKKMMDNAETAGGAGGVPAGAAASNAATIKTHTVVKEDFQKIFEGTDVSPDFIDKAAILFEAAVASRVAIDTVAIEEQFEAKMNEAVEEIKEQNDIYLEHSAKEYFEDNKLAVESSLKVELYKTFVEDVINVFRDHYIDLPEERVDAFQRLADQVDALEAKVNERTQEVIDLTRALNEKTAQATFDKVANDMTDTDKARLVKMSESLDLDESYGQNLALIVETHFKTPSVTKTATPKVLTEGEVITVKVEHLGESTGPKSSDPAVQAIADKLTQFA